MDSVLPNHKQVYLGVISTLFLFISIISVAQDKSIDSLQHEYQIAASEKLQIDILNKLSFAYTSYSHEKSRELAQQAIDQSLTIGYEKGVADGHNSLGISFALEGKLDSAISNFLETLRLREQLKDEEGIAKVLNNLAGPYILQQDYDKAIDYSRQSLVHLQGTENWEAIGNAFMSLGLIYETKNDYDSALILFQMARDNFIKGKRNVRIIEVSIYIASIYANKNKLDTALAICLKAQPSIERNDINIIDLYNTMASIYLAMNKQQLAFDYLHKAYAKAKAIKARESELGSLSKLSDAFANIGRFDSAFFYHKKLADLRFENYTTDKVKQVTMLEKLYETEKKDKLLAISEQKIKIQSRLLLAGALLLTFIIIFIFIILYYNRKSNQLNIQLIAMNQAIQEKSEEIAAQAHLLEDVNREMERMNANLEAEVQHRSQRIVEQSKMLVEYAYFNAHHLRGPLARILGLISLLQLQKLSPDQSDIVQKMNTSAQELDVVVKEINKRLDEETH